MSGINSQLLKMLLVKKVRTLFSGYYTEIGKEAFFLFDEGELSPLQALTQACLLLEFPRSLS